MASTSATTGEQEVGTRKKKPRAKGSTGRETAGQGSGAGGQNITSGNGVGGGGGSTGAVTPAATGGTGGGDGSESLKRTTHTGFGNQFAPGAYAQAWANPEAVIRQWFNGQGMATDTGLEAMLQELQPSLGIQFLAANNQAGKTAGDLDASHYLDYTGQALNQSTQANGRHLGVDQMLDALLHPQNDVLKSHLSDSSLSPSDQVTNMLSAMRYGLQPELPTPVLNAILNQVNNAGKDYQAQMLTDPKHQTQNFSEILAGMGLM